MRRLKQVLRRVTKAPGVPQARHVAERVVAPYLRADVHSIYEGLLATVERVGLVETNLQRVAAEALVVQDAVADLERHMPSVLNAIASTNGTSRLLRRELERLSAQVVPLRDELIGVVERESATRIDAEQAIRNDFSTHIDTVAWLLRRVELIRAEVLNEVRYGSTAPNELETQVVNPAALEPADGVLRINLGSGHLPIEGFANVDMRTLPGVDVIAPIDNLPVEPGTVDEIFSAHTLEHFPEEKLRRSLLPYWFGLLKPGGMIRAVVPDMDAMSQAYVAGSLQFDTFRQVAYGGQEYEGDFHFTGFTPSSIADLFTNAGFVDAKIIARGRPNGDCLECEVAAVRPVS